MAAKDHPNTLSSNGRGWLLAGYAGAAGFFVQELFLRGRGTASSLKTSGDDNGTTRMLLISAGLGYGLPLVLRRLPLPMLPSAAAATGLIIEAGGLALRVWSMRTLGSFYTRTLRTTQGQHLVNTGPYRMIRHPGYTGALMLWIGLALSSRSAPTTVLVPTLMGRAYHRRIVAEENLMRRAIPEYRDYSRRTKKLIPFIW